MKTKKRTKQKRCIDCGVSLMLDYEKEDGRCSQCQAEGDKKKKNIF